jgi:hypothetical protein
MIFSLKHYGRLALLFTGMALVIVLGVVQLPTPRASADTGLQNSDLLPQCGDTTLGDWDWADSAQGLIHIGGTNGMSDFDYQTSSYVILHEGIPTVGGSTNNNRYYVYLADPGKQLILDEVSGVGHIESPNASIRQANIIDEPPSIPAYNGNWPGSFSANAESTSTNGRNTATLGVSITVYSGQTSPPTYDCEFVAHNVTYGPGWGINHFNANGIHGTGSVGTCSALDIPCEIGKLVTGIQNTIVSGVQAVLNAFASLFVPDSTQLQTEYSSLSTSLATHLGFLTYPLTFVVDLFNSFSSSSSWCSSSGCVKDFGSIYGHDYSLDIAAVAEAWPSAWTLISAAMRGMIVLALMLAIWRKFIEIMNSGAAT